LEVVAPAGDNIVSTFRSGDATAANNAGGGFRSISSATAASRVAQVWLDADGANLSGGDYFYIQKNGSSGTVEFNQFSNAAMIFSTNGTERARFNSTGNLAFANGLGIDFSAVTGGTGTATGNVLNDYEEGTFVPTVRGSTTAGSATYSPGAQNGYYTKVGRLVTVQGYLVWSGLNGIGNLQIGGLPFTSSNSTSNYTAVTFGLVDGVSLTAGNILCGYTDLSSTIINIAQTPSGGGSLTFVPVDAAGGFIFTCSYFA
jgi:hypothetical protein